MGQKTNHEIAIVLTHGGRGHFMAALGTAYCLADSVNRKRLEQAFPHVFTHRAEETCLTESQ